MHGVSEELWGIEIVGAIGFCRFLLQHAEIDIETGLILVCEDDWSARQLEQNLLETFHSKQISTWKSRKRNYPFNYEIGIHLFQKYDKEEEWTDFLSEKAFLPIIIVGGIVPEFLYGKGYVFPMEIKATEIKQFGNIYKEMQEEVITNIQHTLCELNGITTSVNASKIAVAERYSNSIYAFLAAGKIWSMVLRKNNSEKMVNYWLDCFCKQTEENINAMEEYEQGCDVEESVIKCIKAFCEHNTVLFEPLGEAFARADILYDDEFYYVTDDLMRRICIPLTRNISFLQLKKEMWQEGFLVCNNGNRRNFTVKKICFDPESGQYKRRRFLKIVKLGITTDEGLTLEDAAFLSEKEEEDMDENRSF